MRKKFSKLVFTAFVAGGFLLVFGNTLTFAKGSEFVYLGGGVGALNTDAKFVSLQITSHSENIKNYLAPYGLQGQFEWSLFGVRGDGLDSNDVAIIGFSPVLRFVPKNTKSFFEFGIGPYLFSERMLNKDNGVGTAFEFGSLAGFGLRLGENSNAELGYRIMHFSNAGMTSFNPGVNIHQIRFGYRF